MPFYEQTGNNLNLTKMNMTVYTGQTVMWVLILYRRKPHSFDCILFIKLFEQTFSKCCFKSLRKYSFFQNVKGTIIKKIKAE